MAIQSNQLTDTLTAINVPIHRDIFRGCQFSFLSTPYKNV